MADLVEELRNDLRNKRTDTIRSNSEFASGEAGTSLQALQREGGYVVPTHRRVNLVEGGVDTQPERLRRPVGRPRRDNSSIHDGTTNLETTTGTRRKRIKAEDKIERTYEQGLAPSPIIPKRPLPKVPKVLSTVESVEKKVVGGIKDLLPGKGSKPLTKAEADALSDPLKAVIPDMAGYLDQFIWWQTHDETHEPVWSNLDDDEVNALSRLLIKTGQKNSTVAEGVRTIVDANDYISAAIIIAPRVHASIRKLTAEQREQRRKVLEARYSAQQREGRQPSP